jgi:hypothetical protein
MTVVIPAIYLPMSEKISAPLRQRFKNSDVSRVLTVRSLNLKVNTNANGCIEMF